jgi:hypothetical protein
MKIISVRIFGFDEIDFALTMPLVAWRICHEATDEVHLLSLRIADYIMTVLTNKKIEIVLRQWTSVQIWQVFLLP